MTCIEQIGDCTLYLGDCRDVLPTLESNSVDMIWTDPPYGNSNHDGDWNARLNEHRGIENKPISNDSPEAMREIVDFALQEASRILKSDCCCCCCCCGGGGGPRPTFAWLADRMDRKGLEFFHSVIWDKINPGLGWRYRRRHEMIMISYRKGGKLLWRDDGQATTNVIQLSAPRERFHPNEKPIPLSGHFIMLHSSVGHAVLDPFMGSGTTGISAARLGRRFIGIEIEPKYFDIACKRIDDAYRQGDMFRDQPRPKPKQEALL